MDNNVKVDQIVLQDGRRAERHTSVDAEGKEVVEIFAEERKPLKLEKRIVREKAQVVAREITETVQDGVVVDQETKEIPVPTMQVTQHIGLADHAKVVDGEYVKRSEIGQMITDNVIAGIQALVEAQRDVQPEAPVPQQVVQQAPMQVAPQPRLSAQAAVEQNVEEKKKGQLLLDIALGVLIAGQVGFFIYYVVAVM
jgi:hypothetical protein